GRRDARNPGRNAREHTLRLGLSGTVPNKHKGPCMFRSGTSRRRPAAAAAGTLAVATLAAATLAACGTSGGADGGPPGGDPDSIDIVASTSIYASIAEAVLGESDS